MRPTADKHEGRPRQVTGPHHDIASPVTTIPQAGEATRLLELSDERDLWLRRLQDEYRAAWRAGYEQGVHDGRDLEGAERDELWNAMARGVLEVADPKGPEARDSAARRLRAAEAGSRRDADEHWRQRWAELHRLSRDDRFVREARMVDPPWRRDYSQAMALVLHDARKATAA